MAELGQCSGTVLESGTWPHYHQCTRKAVVARDGKSYCTIHDPEYIKEKDRKRREAWDAESKAKERQREYESAQKTATYGLTIEELKRLTPALCKAAPELAEALKGLIQTATILWDNAKPIKDTHTMTVTHPTIEQAKAALSKAGL